MYSSLFICELHPIYCALPQIISFYRSNSDQYSVIPAP